MSVIHKQITKEEIENPDLDKEILSLLTAQCNDYVVNKDEVQQVVNGKQTEADAVSKEAKHFDSFFLNEEKLCRLVMQEYHSKLPEQKQVVQGLKVEKKKLEDSGIHQEKGAERFNGSLETKKSINFFKWLGIVLYFAGFISTVYLCVFQAEMDWASAIFIPVAGVLVALIISKLFLFSLLESKNLKTREILYPILKYTFLVVGLTCTIAWIYYFSKFVGGLMDQIDVGSLGGTDAPSAETHKSTIMIFLGALGETLGAAVATAHSYETNQKYTVFDGLKDSPKYAEVKENLSKAENAVDISNDRINHAQNLLAIVDGKREHVKSKTASIYNELFHASIN